MRCRLLFFLPLICFATITASAQEDDGFPYGQPTIKQLTMTAYAPDSSASAVVLNEFGETSMESDGKNHLLFYYHVLIKILTPEALKLANIEIPLHKNEYDGETLRRIKASSYNLENGQIKEATVNDRQVFTEKRGPYLEVKKIAIPNVHVGSVIEFEYVTTSPWISNFKNWEFQGDIPKLVSEYWARIPGNLVYNITLKGFLKLSKNESELIKDCFTPGGGHSADCGLYKYQVTGIPAFVEEDYMTARSNFVSAINFELSEIRYFDGRVDKITKEWKDVDLEFRRHQQFGVQLRKGKDLGEEYLEPLITGVTDPLQKATRIYHFIQKWYDWNGSYGKYSDNIKKAFDQKKGDVGDVNLSLIAALRYAGLQADPMILSTRDNGFPIEIHPVITDFNYVVAVVTIGDKTYYADATDDFLPFGMLPERCLNGKGRVLTERDSYWIDIKPTEKSKRLSITDLKLHNDGVLRGTIQTTYIGYRAVAQRRKIYSFDDEESYIADFARGLKDVDVRKFSFENLNELEKPLVQKMEIEIHEYEDLSASTLFFNPFILGKMQENPFKSSDRLFPVDFATLQEHITIMNLEIPPDYVVVDLPAKAALALPNSGGRYFFEVQQNGGKLSMNSALSLNKTIFTSSEYHSLKELFARIIQTENIELVLKKKI